jgi:hypothetical protein
MENGDYLTLNKEVFIAIEDFDTNFKAKLTESMEDLQDYLITLNPEDYPEMKVIHGIITKAKYIPEDIRSQKCFIMVLDPGCFIDSLDLECTIIESDSGGDSDVLAEEIESIVKDATNLIYMPDIDDIFIIYGYTMEVGLCINPDSADEECIDTCEHVAEAAGNIQR